MDEKTWQSQRTSFGAVADVYEQARPDYPAAAVRWLVGDAPRRVLDLGAGTGKLTRQLAAEGHEVVAVEPLPEMRQTLLRSAPGLTVLGGSAESIPLPDSSVDVVLAAQAYHWFVPERAHPEIARVLRPGCVFGVLWNLRDDGEPWVAALTKLLSADDSSSNRMAEHPPEMAPHFTAGEGQWFAHDQRMDLERLLALVSSRSYVIRLPEPERAALLANITELTRTHPDLAGKDTFTMPYRTLAYRTIRSA